MTYPPRRSFRSPPTSTRLAAAAIGALAALSSCAPSSDEVDATRATESKLAAEPITRKVAVVQYDPTNPSMPSQKLSEYKGWGDAWAHADVVAAALRDATGGLVNFQIVDKRRILAFPVKRDGFRYDWESYLACRNDDQLCHFPDDAAYLPVMTGEAGVDYCQKIASGEIDEIWIYGAGYFGFDEFAYKIPGDNPMHQPQPANDWLYELRKKDLPECGRTYFVMGYLAERTEGAGLHSFGHRMESALSLSPAGNGYWHRCGAQGKSAWTDFTCIDQDSKGNAGCGDVHFPPNGQSDYDYANTNPVESTCEDWLNYPNLTGAKTTVSKDTWDDGSGEDGYLSWWMGHIPATGGEQNGVLNNWWHYALCYDQKCATAPVNPTLTCDNNVPLNGTACAAGDLANEYLCVDPGGSNPWQAQPCPSGQTCQGDRCQPAASVDCSAYDTLESCDAHGADCAWYLCSDKCFPRGTPNEHACGCGKYDTVQQCDADPDGACAWYFCSNTCWQKGTPNETACP